jgi:hypothetical protein
LELSSWRRHLHSQARSRRRLLPGRQSQRSKIWRRSETRQVWRQPILVRDPVTTGDVIIIIADTGIIVDTTVRATIVRITGRITMRRGRIIISPGRTSDSVLALDRAGNCHRIERQKGADEGAFFFAINATE